MPSTTDINRVQQKYAQWLVSAHVHDRDAHRLLKTVRQSIPLHCHFCSHLISKIVGLGKRLIERSLPNKLSRDNSCTSSDSSGSGENRMATALNFAN